MESITRAVVTMDEDEDNGKILMTRTMVGSIVKMNAERIISNEQNIINIGRSSEYIKALD